MGSKKRIYKAHLTTTNTQHPSACVASFRLVFVGHSAISISCEEKDKHRYH